MTRYRRDSLLLLATDGKTVVRVWLGEKHFQVLNYHVLLENSLETLNGRYIDFGLPTQDLVEFALKETPTVTAYNNTTKVRYSMRLRRRPYLYIIRADKEPGPYKEEPQLSTLRGLEKWERLNGLDVKDLQGTDDSAIGLLIAAPLRLLSRASQLGDEEYIVYGGERAIFVAENGIVKIR